jgi:hypothetical protein
MCIGVALYSPLLGSITGIIAALSYGVAMGIVAHVLLMHQALTAQWLALSLLACIFVHGTALVGIGRLCGREQFKDRRTCSLALDWTPPISALVPVALTLAFRQAQQEVAPSDHDDSSSTTDALRTSDFGRVELHPRIFEHRDDGFQYLYSHIDSDSRQLCDLQFRHVAAFTMARTDLPF